MLESVAVGQSVDRGRQGCADGPGADDDGATEVLHPSGKDFRSGAGVSVHKDRDASAITLRSWVDDELELGMSQVHGAKVVVLLIEEPAGHPHGHCTHAPGISPQVDDDGVHVAERFYGISEGGHEVDRIKKAIEGDVARAIVEFARFQPDITRRQVGGSEPLAFAWGQFDRFLDASIVAV